MPKRLAGWRAQGTDRWLSARSGQLRRSRYVTWWDSETLPGDDGTHRAFLVCAESRAPAPSRSWRYSSSTHTDMGEFVDEVVLAPFVGGSRKVREHVLVAHNAGFDVRACGMVALLADRGFELNLSASIISETSRPFYLVFDRRLEDGVDKRREGGAAVRKYSHRVIFTDLGNFFADSLAALGKTFGVPKGSFEFHSGELDRFGGEVPDFARSRAAAADLAGAVGAECVEYCARDVLIVRRAWEALEDFMDVNQLGPLKQTVAATAMNIYRSRFYDAESHPIQLHSSPSLFDLEVASYKGGAVTMLQNEPILTDFSGVQVDFFSMYASIMVTDLPHRVVDHQQGGTVSGLRRHFVPGRTAIARVALDIPATTPLPRLPVVLDDTLMMPTGTFTTTLAGSELLHAIEQGYVVSVAEYAVYDSAPILKAYSEFFMSKKSLYATEGNKVFETLAKLFGNSLYGKWGQTVEKFAEAPDPGGDGPPSDVFEDAARLLHLAEGTPYVDVADGETGMVWRAKSVDGRVMVSSGWRESSSHTNMAISACITAEARMRLFALADVAGADEVLYADTDSWIVTDAGYARLESSGRLYAGVGGAMPEMRIVRLRISGLKHYEIHGYPFVKTISAFGDEIIVKRRHKGIRIRVNAAGDVTNFDPKTNEYLVTQFGKFHPQVIRGGSDGVPVREIRKTALPARYRKGSIGGDGRVTPVHLVDGAPSTSL